MIVGLPLFFTRRLWLLIGIFILVINAASGQWLTGYQFRKEVLIPDANITGGPHSDFPLLIDLSGDADIIANAESASGFDIAFTDTDGTTLLDHEIFTPDRTDYRAFLRVTLPATGDKVFYIYYGNSSVTVDPSTPTAWNTNYQAVLHLQESGSGNDDEFPDATSNGYDGTGGGTLGAGDGSRTPVRTTGKFGFAQQFDGTDDRIRLRPLDETNPGPTWTAVTVQAWVNISTAQDGAIFGKTWGLTTNDQTWLLQASPTSLGTRVQTDVPNSLEYNPYVYSTGNWYLAVATWDAADDQLRVYINGTEQTPSQSLVGSQIYSTGIPAQGQLPTIGNIPAFYGERPLNGLIQETRVSNVAYSADWIRTEFDNQNDPAGYISKNNEEKYPDNTLGVVAAENPICEGNSTSIIVSNSETGVNYQLRDDADDSNIGPPLAGTGGTIYLPSGSLSIATTFNVLATNDPGTASVELLTKPTVSINPNPTATLISDKDGDGNEICEGEPVLFTASGGTTYEFFINGFGVQGPGITDTYSTSSLDDGDVVTAEVTDGNGCTSTSNAINMTVNLLPDALAVPNSDILCSETATNIVLSNPNGVGASYTWTVVESGVTGGSNQVTPVAGPIIDVLSTTGAASGTATYTITPISSPGCIGPSTQSEVTVNPKPDNTNSISIDRTVICSGETVTVTIQSADPGINYEVLDGGNNVISNVGSVAGESDLDITTYGIVASTLIQVRATNGSTGCVIILTDTDNVSVSSIDIQADIDTTPLCEDDPVGINLNSITNDPGIGSVIYSWTGPAGFSSGVADPLAFNNTSPNWPGIGLHTYTLTVTDDSGSGCVFISTVDVDIDEKPAADAGTGGDECGLSFLFNATPSTGSGVWTQQAGPGSSSYNNANSPNATVTVDSYGTYTYRWTETNGVCSDFAEIVVNFYENPIADAGSGGDICGKDAANPFTLNGTASVGTGTWTQQSGPGASNFFDPNAASTDVTVDTYGNYVFRWTEVNGICSDFDEVSVNFNEDPSIANAGSDIDQCNSSVFTMAANAPLVGTGTWSIVSGPGVITDPSSPTTTVTGVTAGDGSVPTILEWTVSNGSCATNTDQVSLTNYASPTVADAGVDQEQCNLGDFTLAGNNPALGTGLWSIVGPANGAVITTPSAFNSPVTGLNTGASVTIRWTVSNGICADSFDEVVLTNSALPDAAAAGVDQEQCASNIFIMAATPVATGTGTWSIVSGPGVITDPSSPTTTVTGVTAGDGSVPTVLEWTVSNGICATNTDQVSLTNYASPTVADAGPDQEQCVLGDFALAANTPTSGIGLWAIIGPANGAVITDPADPLTTITGLLEESSVTLRWTISNGVCPDSFDEVVLSNSSSADAAVAGPDQEQCESSTFTMAATPVGSGTGTWSILSGPGVITNPSSPTTTVTGVTAGDGSIPTILEWTVSSSSCPNNTDQVSLTNYLSPTASNAGSDQEQCNLGDFTLSGNIPVTGTGLWTIVGDANGAMITTPTANNSTVTGLNSGSSVTLRWNITSGVCTPSFDEVVLTNNALVDAAVAGPDQEQCANSIFTMAATPVTIGEGTWSILSGPGVITNPASPTTTVTGVTAGDGSVPTVLEWTVSNGSCVPNTDQVSLINYSAPTVADAGPDQEQCDLGDFTLSGNTPTSGTGIWSIIGDANGAVITTPADPNSTVTGLTAGASVTLRWTISHGVCPDSFDELVLNNYLTPTMSINNLTPDICEGTLTDITLLSTVPNAVIRLVNVDYASGDISGGTLVGGETFTTGQRIRETLFTNTNEIETVVYNFEVDANGCGPVGGFSTSVDIKPIPELTITNHLPLICNDSTSDVELTTFVAGAAIDLISVTPSDPGVVGGYTLPGGPSYVSGDRIQDNLTNTSNVQQSVIYTFRINANSCINPVDKSVVVTINPTPVISVNGIDICSGDVTNIIITNDNGVPFTTYDWIVQVPNPNISGASSGSGSIIAQVLTNSNTIAESITYRITPSTIGCPGNYVDYEQVVSPGNTVDAGSDVDACEGSGNVSITDASIGGGATNSTWSIISGSGLIVDPNNIVAEYQPGAGELGTITLQLTASDPSTCPDVIDFVDIEIFPEAIVEAGPDDVICEGENYLLAGASRSGSANAITWTSTGSGTFTPNATTLNATYIPHASDAGNTIRLYIESNDPPGPCSPVRDSLDLTINVAPVVSAGTDKIICETDSVQLSDASFGGSATSVTWSGGSGYFYPDENTVDAWYVPDASEVGSAVILTITTNDSDGGGPCNPDIDQVQISINKAPEVYAGVDKIVCEGSNIPLADASTGGTTTSVVWSGGAGTFIPTSSTINAIYQADASEIGSTITLRITSNDPAGPCAAVFDEVDVTIDIAPVVNAGGDKIVCGLDSVLLDDALIGGSAASGIWTGGSGTFYPSANVVNARYLPIASEIGQTITLRLTTNDPSGPCGPVFDEVDVTINRPPAVNAGVDQVVCEGSSVSLNGTLGGGAITATWSGGLGTFTDNTSLIASYIPDPSEAGSVVTLRLTTNDPAGPCIPVFDEMEVTINVAPVVDAGMDDEICIGDTLFLAGSISGSATTATWSGGIGLFSDVNDLNAYYLPDTTERGSQVILTLTTNDPDGSGPCPIVDDRVFQTIHALPNPFFTGLDPQTAINSPPLPLVGFPPGGTFFGDGIATGSSEFNPILAGVGQKYVFYDYTDNNGCSNTYLDSILVNPTPDIDFGIDPAVCENADQIPLMATPTGGIFEGTGVTSIGGGSYIFDPDVAGIGEHIISYAFTDPQTGATDTAFQQVQVLAVPVPDFSIDSFTCVDSLIQFTDQSTIDPSSEITARLWRFGDGSEDTAQNPQYQYEASGIYYATLRAFSQPVLSTTCTDITPLIEIRVGGRPDVEMTASNFVFGDITQFTDLTTFPEGIPDDMVAAWSWDFDDGDFGSLQNPTHQYDNDGKYTVRLNVQSTRGCVDLDSLRIAIIPVVQEIDPEVGWEDDFEFLDNWVAEPIEDPLNSWEVGQPAGAVINSASSGQNAWVSNLTGLYNNEERSWVKSPAFDLTGLTKPMVQFDYWSHMNETTDGVTLEYSIDGGANWYLIGNKENLQPNPGEQWYGINWYDGERIFNVFGVDDNTLDNPNQVGWTSHTDGWKTARIYLDPIIERHGYGDPVIFRFTLAAGATSIGDNKDFEGFAFDNFVLKNRTQNILIEQYVDFTSEDAQFFVRNDMYPFINDTLTYTDNGRNATDVIYLQLHYNYAGGDEVFEETPEIAERYKFYGNPSSPRNSIADGILDERNDLLDKNDVIRRALFDPKFKMELTVDEGINLEPDRDQITVKVSLTANENLDEPLKLYLVVLEDNFNKFDFGSISVLRNLGRQMISDVPDEPPTGGIPLPSQWTMGENRIVEFTADLYGYSAGNPDEFKVVAFVQNQENQDIHQAASTDSPYPKEPKPVGIEDEISHADFRQLNIYPQPARHFAIVDFGRELSRDYDWEIIDQRGVIIGRGTVLKGETGFEINTGLLPNGIHFLLIGDNQGLKMHRKLTILH